MHELDIMLIIFRFTPGNPNSTGESSTPFKIIYAFTHSTHVNKESAMCQTST